MGPRSSDRGYALINQEESNAAERASMGPRSSDRGYDDTAPFLKQAVTELQWVHGPQTVVMEVVYGELFPL